MTDLGKQEVLLTALSGYGYAARRVQSGDLSMEAVRADIQASNVLLDAAIDCGMSHDEIDHVAWAAERVTRFLCAA